MEGSKSEEFLCKQGSCFVDVRNLAEAHVKSLEVEKAGGERIIVSAGKCLAGQSSSYRHINLQF